MKSQRLLAVTLVGLSMAVLLAAAPPSPAEEFDPAAAADAAWAEEMRELAEEGDAEAMVELGRVYVERGDTAGAEQWLERAEAAGANVPPDLLSERGGSSRTSPASAGWGAGKIERRTKTQASGSSGRLGPCESTSGGLDLALRRADLALAEGDLERWITAIVPLVRAGCRSPELTARIERARAVEERLQSERDREIASAVRRGRPTVGTGVGRSAGRPLDPPDSGASAWAQIAGELISIVQRDEPPSSSPGRRIPENADQATRNAYAGIWADTQDQIEKNPEEDYWAGVAEQVKGLTRQKNPETREVDPSERSPGATGISDPAVVPPSGAVAPPDGLDAECSSAPESDCPAELKRPGAECRYCAGPYGLGNYFWYGGRVPQPQLKTAGCHVFSVPAIQCESDNFSNRKGPWWVWRSEERWNVEKRFRGIEEPVLYPWRTVIFGLEKPKGCTPDSKARDHENSEFELKTLAGPFDHYDAARDYANKQKDACCASAAAEGSTPRGCEG